MPRPKLLAVDLDGTLLDHNGVPHVRDIEALHRASREGIVVTIVTGRLYSGTRQSAEAVGIRGPVACVDGNHVVHTGTDTTLVHHGLERDHALHLRAILARRGPASFLLSMSQIVHDESGSEFLPYMSKWSTDLRQAEWVPDDPSWDDDGAVTAVVSIGTEDQILSTRDDLVERVGDGMFLAVFQVSFGGHWALFARANHADKGTALAWLAHHHGCTLAETVCVGDWINDIPMLRVAGRSYAMPHAPPEVKSAASDVLPDSAAEQGAMTQVLSEAFGLL
jgi:Cof subfamily protein (haloacid dehalogenase superfamily)